MLHNSLRPGERYSANQISFLFRIANSLRLSAEELDTLCIRYALMRTEIAQIEANRARATQIDKSTIRVFIPSYAEEGLRFRREWNSFLIEAIGAERAAAFAAEIPDALDVRTANFGAASQEYTVTAFKDASGAPRLYITRLAAKLSTDTASPSRIRESVSTLDCDLQETDGGELSVLRPFTEGLAPVSTEEEKRLHHP